MLSASLYSDLKTATITMASSHHQSSAYSPQYQYEQSSTPESETGTLLSRPPGQTNINSDATFMNNIHINQSQPILSAPHQQTSSFFPMPSIHRSTSISSEFYPEPFRSTSYTACQSQTVLFNNSKSMSPHSVPLSEINTSAQLTTPLPDYQHSMAVASSPEGGSESGSPRKPRKTFDCDRCDKQFSRHQDARRHMNSVHLKTTYTCNICCRKFSRKDVFKRHLSSSQQHKAGGQRQRQQHHHGLSTTEARSRRNADTLAKSGHSL